MAEEITFSVILSRGIIVITNYFSTFINDNILERNNDFEMIIIISQILFFWMEIKKMISFIIEKIWTFKKYTTWKKVIDSSFYFITSVLIFLLTQIIFIKLSELSQDINFDVLEIIVTLFFGVLLIWLAYYKSEKYSKI